MDRQTTTAHGSHSRLIVSLLALALGATFGMAAPQALASSAESQLPGLPKITLAVSPTSSRPNQKIKVTGDVSPVEYVGDFATLVVQRKVRGRWTQVSRARAQVVFTPPGTWLGKFNMKTTDLVWNSFIGDWQGQVLYGSPRTKLTGHYTEYSMTSANGTLTAEGSVEVPDVLSLLYEYSGSPLRDAGTLRWYFAEADGGADGIAADSYEGYAFHSASGVLTGTSIVPGLPPTSTEVPDVLKSVEGKMWDGETTRPLLEAGHMSGVRERPWGAEYGLTMTQKLDWDLAPAEVVLPYERRVGNYKWTGGLAQKGLYRLQATIDHGALHSPWRRVTVR